MNAKRRAELREAVKAATARIPAPTITVIMDILSVNGFNGVKKSAVLKILDDLVNDGEIDSSYIKVYRLRR